MAGSRMALLLVAGVCALTVQGEINVETTDGIIRGTPISIPNISKQGYGFFGVPYAAPPVGNMRFAPPQPVEPWSGVRTATVYGPACPQDVSNNMLGRVLDFSNATDRIEMTSSEDCLHLDIYTSSLNGSHPVMVWIHPGGFRKGWAALYNGRALALLQDVVMVTLQYRLGPLGFFRTEDGLVSGNMGLMDQVAALKWIQKNIDRFGGDPDQVTIFGNSAGAWSASYHLVSPHSRGLFKRAILQSGSLVGSVSLSPPLNVTGSSKILATAIGCPQKSSEELLQCMRDIQDPDVFWNNEAARLFVPVVDGDFLPEDPAVLLLEGRYNREVDIILGVTEIEGYLLTGYKDIFRNPDKSTFQIILNGTVTKFLPQKVEHREDMVAAILKEYASDLTGQELARAVAECTGDAFITKDVYHTAKILSANGDGSLYFYEFRQTPSISLKPPYIRADHSDDLYYCFGESHTETFFGYSGMSRTADDQAVEDLVVSYWTNFARTGDPNGGKLPSWPSYRQNETYLILQRMPQVAHNFRPERMKFWMETFPVAAGDPPIPFPPPTSKSSASSVYFLLGLLTIWVALEVHIL